MKKSTSPEPHDADRRVETRSRFFQERALAILIIFVVLVVPVVTFGFGPAILDRYDRDHKMSVDCKVNAEDGDIASSRSLKGAGGSEPQVTFQTECGNILFLDGVDGSNMRALASRVTVEQTYRFVVGSGSYDLRAALKVFKVAPVAFSYETA